MSGLIHQVDQLEDGVVALRCPRCNTRFDDLMDAVFDGGDLKCPDCGDGGMLPCRSSTVAERFPQPLAAHWMPIPQALLKRRVELGLSAHELLVVITLESHRRSMGQLVYPSRETIAELTGLSVATVKRAVIRLAAAGLINRRQPDRRPGYRDVNHYDLHPLWDRLAILESRGSV